MSYVYLTPGEVRQLIEKDGGDIYIDFTKIVAGSKGDAATYNTRYGNIMFTGRVSNGVPLPNCEARIQFRNIETCYRIRSPDQRKFAPQLAFSYDQEEGSEAADLIWCNQYIMTRFRELIEKAIKSKTLKSGKKEIITNVQTEVSNNNVDETKAGKEFDYPVMRYKVKFERRILDNGEEKRSSFKTRWYDVSRQSFNAKTGKKNIPPAMVDDCPIDENNVHQFVTRRSIIGGKVNYNSFSISGQGISLSPMLSEVVVKPGEAFEPDFDYYTENLEVDADADVNVAEIVDEDSDNEITSKRSRRKSGHSKRELKKSIIDMLG